MKRKFFILLVVFLLSLSLCLVACNKESTDDTQNQEEFINPGDNLNGGKEGTMPTEVITIDSSSFSFSQNLDNLSENINSEGATSLSASLESVKISTAGNYILTGYYTSGIVISVGNNETTHIYLNNATIANNAGIAISNTNKKSSLIITVLDGTTNSVTNNGTDVNAIHVKGNLSINGTGTLNIESSSKSGIKVSKALEIVDATINIESNNHGISARSILVDSAEINVEEAKKDGLNAECDDETTEFPDDYSEGFIKLINTNYSCDVDGDGIQADTLVYIEGGIIDIKTNGVFVSYTQDNLTTYELVDDDYRYIKNGSTYSKVASDANYAVSQMYALAQSCKGIKVGEMDYVDGEGNEITVLEGNYLIVITGENTISINSTDDAIHTNSGSIDIISGTIIINTFDDAITSDILTQIEGGTISVESSYEGIEGAYVKILGGTINIKSNDDGINAASDDETIKEYIIINGGNIVVNSVGDGLDSNGSVLITGGTLYVNGPTSGADAALDSETGIIINGGTVFASGTLQMVETPSTNSTQYILSYAQNTSLTAGTILTIKNSNGEEVFTATIQKASQSIIISTPNFVLNGTYTIYGNDSELGTFTVSSIITSVGSNKQAGPGGMGPGGQGDPGQQGGGNFNPGEQPPEKPTQY